MCEVECNICSSGFDIETEGGVEGCVGMLPVAFCPTCFVGIEDMISQFQGNVYCDDCGGLTKCDHQCECKPTGKAVTQCAKKHAIDAPTGTEVKQGSQESAL